MISQHDLPPAGTAAPAAMRSSFLEFSDPGAFSSAIPGGRFGILPMDNAPFRASMELGALSAGLVSRRIRTGPPVSMRAEFTGSARSIILLLPMDPAPRAVLDGREMSGCTVVTRLPGDTPHLRTYGETELAAIVLVSDLLRRASAALTGEEHDRLLQMPGRLRAVEAPRLQRLRLEIGRLGRVIRQPALEMRDLAVLRRSLIAAIVDTVAGSDVKSDHLATRLQTLSMARIERQIDEARNDPIGLQELCEGTGLALRTIETIVKRRTGMSAHAYLARRRLAFAREALVSPAPETSVTRIAMDHGFYHLGRFSGFYRGVYGETPSVTLRRALAGG
ncbi:AraC family transcriptional regulator [Mangrovicoccus algicola]|uniref:AraC family transcriptional regulator n=1 Tax=Mangrovicoccus algicola TaxID=2771008 RepID=A0A8J6Z6V5_9RHOB|nr:helix-turn-helix domain-containing protein [Mangrovicoccus algicola]MBE3637565.1 AraC family transcriptional regulator [Mangrovicoccus algicola]